MRSMVEGLFADVAQSPSTTRLRRAVPLPICDGEEQEDAVRLPFSGRALYRRL